MIDGSTGCCWWRPSPSCWCWRCRLLAQEADRGSREARRPKKKRPSKRPLTREPFAGEITVTSRRREEALQEIPIAVSVVAGDQLEDIAASDISELEGYVPNLSIYQGRNQSTTLTAFIRGVGQADPLWGVDPGVGLYIDDVYIARAQGALLDVYDVAAGRGAARSAGDPVRQEHHRWRDQVRDQAAVGHPRGQASPGTPGPSTPRSFGPTISGPIVKGKLRGKASFAKLTRDGYGTNLYQNREVSNKNTKAYRLGLEWLPSEKVSLRVGL